MPRWPEYLGTITVIINTILRIVLRSSINRALIIIMDLYVRRMAEFQWDSFLITNVN